MKYLNKVLEANGIGDDKRERASALYLEAKGRLQDTPLVFGEDAQLMFSNHLMALAGRLLEGRLVDPVEDTMFGEISKEAWAYAKQVVGPLFAATGAQEDPTELFLVGTHMEMAMAAGKEI